MSEKPDPKELTDKEQQRAVDRGELAVCISCGAMTWVEGLKGGKCPCGETPFVSGGPLPEVELRRANESSDMFVDKMMGRIESNISNAEGELPVIPVVRKGNAAPRPGDTVPTGRLGRAVYKLRDAIGQTQEDFANTLGVHKNTVYNLETGKTDKMQTGTRYKFIAVAKQAGLDHLADKFRR